MAVSRHLHLHWYLTFTANLSTLSYCLVTSLTKEKGNRFSKSLKEIDTLKVYFWKSHYFKKIAWPRRLCFPGNAVGVISISYSNGCVSNHKFKQTLRTFDGALLFTVKSCPSSIRVARFVLFEAIKQTWPLFKIVGFDIFENLLSSWQLAALM